MSSQSKQKSEFCKAKSLSVESDYANRNEIKRLDNNSEKGFSNDIDKLNESLYKINNYLKLTKEIEDLKKDSLVRNDIQRKLSLKSQWLSSNHGSTASLNSLPPSSNSKNASGYGSTQSLNKGEVKKNFDSAKKKRKNFENFKSQSVQNVNAACDRPIRRFGKRSISNSYEELDFLDKLKLSDEEISRLSQEPNFQDKKGAGGASKLAERKLRVRSLSASQTSSVSSSQRDLSRFFPKKEVKSKPVNVNKNQKELKDVDLSKYFLPTPVQELKSLPSPGQSPKLPRKPMIAKSFDETQSTATASLLRTAIDNLQKIKRPESLDSGDEPSVLRDAIDNLHRVEKTETLNVEPKMEGFTLRNHQLDGDAGLQKPSKADKFQFEKFAKSEDHPCSGYESIPLADIKSERKKSDTEIIFESMKAPVDNIDELFEKVAADVLPELPKPKVIEKVPIKSQPPKIIRKVAEKKPIEIKKVEIKSSFPPASKWFRKEKVNDPNKREAEILSKLSSNLLNEIKLLEQHLQLNDENKAKEDKKVKKVKKDKKAEEPIDKCKKESNQTEEELNSAIDDILKSMPLKEEPAPRSVTKKIKHLILPKPSQGLRSDLSQNVEKEPPQTKNVPVAPKLASPKQQKKKSTDTVDAAVDFSFTASVNRVEEKPLVRSSEMVQRVASIEKDIATFMVEQSIPSIDGVRSAKLSNDRPKPIEPKIEITQPTPQIEKDEITFTFVKPARKRTPETKPTTQASVPKTEDTKSIASTSNGSLSKDLKTKNASTQEQKIQAIPRDAQENEPIKKPSVNELIQKITPTDKERPSIENKLLFQSNRKPMLSKTYKVHLPIDEPAPTVKPKISMPSDNEKPIENEAIKIKTEPSPLVPKQAQSQIKSDKIETKDQGTRKSKTDSFKRDDSTEARNAFFADWDELNNKPRSPVKPIQPAFQKKILMEANKPKTTDIASPSNVVKPKVEPPVKPVRRSRKTSVNSINSINEVTCDDEQITLRKNEPSPNAPKKHTSLPSSNLTTHGDANLKQDEDPPIKNIAQILDAQKSPKTTVEVVELMDDHVKPTNKYDLQSNIENNDTKRNETDDNKLMDPRKFEHRLSGSSEYDNVVPAVTRRAKLSETRKQSRSFELPCETDCDYDNVDVSLARKSADRFSPPPSVSTLDRKKNVTDMLLERSKNLHHKKQEFMTEKLTESNPYIRRMMEKETRFRPNYERSRISPLTSSVHYTQPYSHSISRPLPSSITTTSSPLSYNTRVTAPSSSTSSSRGVLDRFRHPTSSSNKDSCTIS